MGETESHIAEDGQLETVAQDTSSDSGGDEIDPALRRYWRRITDPQNYAGPPSPFHRDASGIFVRELPTERALIDRDLPPLP